MSKPSHFNRAKTLAFNKLPVLIHYLHTSRYSAYDADAFTPCRYHMLKRSNATVLPDGKVAASIPENGSHSNTTASSSAPSLSSAAMSTSVPPPGSAGRWVLREDPSGFQQYSHMLARVSAMLQVGMNNLYGWLALDLRKRLGFRVYGKLMYVHPTLLNPGAHVVLLSARHRSHDARLPPYSRHWLSSTALCHSR